MLRSSHPLPPFRIARISYSKVPPLGNVTIRTSGLISLNEVHLYKKLSTLIHVQFLLQWYTVMLYGIYLNMSPIGLNSLEARLKVLCPNCYDFQETFSTGPNYQFLVQLCIFLKCFLCNFDSCLEYKNVSFTMVYTPCSEEVYLSIRNQSGCFCETSFLKAGLYCTPKLCWVYVHLFVKAWMVLQ